MARQNQLVEVNSFVKGLITEASPLTFPENASLDEDNFNLRRDGSRDRRLGMDMEPGYQEVNTGIPNQLGTKLPLSTFSWENVGGIPELTFTVVQTGPVLKIFKPGAGTLSSSELYSKELETESQEQIFSYANIDGNLVIATGSREVNVLSYDGESFSLSTASLKVRDQWGVEDQVGGRDLFTPSGLSVRPTALSDTHLYNLRNQTWGLPKEIHTTDALGDCIEAFFGVEGTYPSNSDNINYALYANPNDSSNRTGEQYHPKDSHSYPVGSFPAPKGYFIIDALKRGSSRVEEASKLVDDHPPLSYSLAGLPSDTTPGGPTSVSEYAGRIWYAGFKGTVMDGDARSPTLSSYVFYSQLVTDPSQITHCYQEGDPTSKESPDLVDTDGGFIRVDGAYNIQALINVGAGILVLAENGVWMISGGSDYGFSANNNMRRKISERGIQSPASVVVVDNTVMFWADDAIYQIGPDQFGDYQAQNMTQTTIQTLYDEIDSLDKFFAQGKYDSYDQKVRWIYNNRIGTDSLTRELIFDINLGAFYTHTISSLGADEFPRVIAPVELPSFTVRSVLTPVVNDGEQVVSGGEDVTQATSIRGSATRELGYVALTSVNPVKYSFSFYQNSSFKDWESVDGVGEDAPAYLVTGYLSGGDFIRYKQVPYVQFYFTRTEDGFQEDGSGNLVATNQSGCLVQAQWEWANSANSNRWGRPFQAYRYKRLYMPSGSDDAFDSGFEVVTTKNKLRGKGRVLSMRISTEPEKDCRLLGWSMLVGVTGNV